MSCAVDGHGLAVEHRSVTVVRMKPAAADDAERRPQMTLANAAPSEAQGSLEDLVLARLRIYARRLQGHAARDMYQLIMPQLERPLLRVAMELAEGRQTVAAQMLGIHRNTLRARLRALGLESKPPKKPGRP